jgi:hypothetical protein
MPKKGKECIKFCYNKYSYTVPLRYSRNTAGLKHLELSSTVCMYHIIITIIALLFISLHGLISVFDVSISNACTSMAQ